MAAIAQKSLFSWKTVERSPEILRLKRVLDVLPDEPLVRALEDERKGKRNDYPIAALWNAIVAGIVFGHGKIASLIRELKRNAELREVCGFDPLLGERAVPPDWVCSRFCAKLLRHGRLIEGMFHGLVEEAGQLLPDLGEDLAIDAKALLTYGRKDPEAAWGVKTYRGTKPDGSTYETVKKWFGYQLHLLIDARYELPIAYRVTPANESEIPYLMTLLEEVEEKHADLHKRARTLAADRAYDNGRDKAALWDDREISPLIDTRDCFTHTGGERMRPLDPSRHDAIYYGPTSEVACKIDPFEVKEEKAFAAMQYMGFEKDRQTLKFRCPAAAFGLECKNREACAAPPLVRDGAFGRVVRVPLQTDRRLFFPAYRHSRTFRNGYKKRAAVERVFSRVDQVYGFERHTIRGLAKMRMRVGLALVVMLATAVAWIRVGQTDKARSLLRAAA